MSLLLLVAGCAGEPPTPSPEPEPSAPEPPAPDPDPSLADQTSPIPPMECTDPGLATGPGQVVVANTAVIAVPDGKRPARPGVYLDTSLSAESENTAHFATSLRAELEAILDPPVASRTVMGDPPAPGSSPGRIWVPTQPVEQGPITYDGCNDAASFVAEIDGRLLRCASISGTGSSVCESLRILRQDEGAGHLRYTVSDGRHPDHEEALDRGEDGLWTLHTLAPNGRAAEVSVIELDEVHKVPLLFTVCDGPIRSMVRELELYQRCIYEARYGSLDRH